MINQYKQRRKQLSKELSDAPIVMSAYAALQLTGDMAAPFRQEASFLYLTGVSEPDWLLVINDGNSCLVAPTLSDSQKLFDGDFDESSVFENSGVDKILDSKAGDELLRAIAEKHSKVYTLGLIPYKKYYGFTENPSQAILNRKLRKLFSDLKDCRPVINRMRAIKSNEEIATIERAAEISIKAYGEVRDLLKVAKYEYEIEALLSSVFRGSGADGHAYDPIVASGKNTLTLHYTVNNDPLPKNGLVLIDAGARLNGYAADITRTYGIGNPNEEARSVHGAVESAHRAIIDMIRPGMSLGDYQKKTDEIMREALDSIGLLNNPSDYRRYFPHAISHGLGLDVHESLGGFKEFQEGMVLTVEPGIYVPESGIGVRIEDTVLVTTTGSRSLGGNLSTSL